MKKIGILLAVILLFTCCFGCSKNRSNDLLSADDLNSINSAIASSAAASSAANSYNGKISTAVYLKKDDLFLLTTNNDKKIVVDKEGKLQEFKNLKSDYLDYSNSNISDIYGNIVTSKFIKDSKNESLVGLCKMDKYDVVWVKEYQETPTSSVTILKAFDEKGTQLYRVDSNDATIGSKLRDISSVSYYGDSVCGLGSSYSYKSFYINVDTSKIIESDGKKFSGGYILKDKKIMDANGSVVQDLSKYDIFSNLYDVNEGLFFNGNNKKFYDIQLNEKIDLSQYKSVELLGEKNLSMGIAVFA